MSRRLPRWCRLVLRLYPAGFRREFGEPMEEMLARRLAEARERGGLDRARRTLREAAGLLAGALRQRAGGALLPDVRYAVRRLARSPGFTAAALLTLGLGLGGTVAIFAFAWGIVLSPLPFPDADRLVAIRHAAPGVQANDIDQTLGTHGAYTRHARTFDAVAAYEVQPLNLLDGEAEPERLAGAAVTAGFFDVLGVPPRLGRGLTADDQLPGAPPVMVLGHGTWRRRYGADPEVIGRVVRLEDVSTEIVGVMPPGFDFPGSTRLWMPLEIDPAVEPPVSFSYAGIGRLSPGVSMEAAEADLRRSLRTLGRESSRIDEDFLESSGLTPFLRPLKVQVIGDVGRTMWILVGAVGFVLLIACANVANLLLVRAEGRRREVAVRRALGAGTRDLIRFHLSESLILTLGGAITGLALAAVAVPLLLVAGPVDLPRASEVAVGPAAVLFLLVVATLIGVVFGLAPLASRSRTAVPEAVAADARGSTPGREAGGLRQALIVAQVALALVLLTGAGLMARTTWNLSRVDPGFRAAGVLTFRISLPRATYPAETDAVDVLERVRERLEAIPSVESAGLARCLPLQGWCGGNPASSPDSPLPPEGFRKVVAVKPVSPGYFRTLGISLRSGRGFVPDDHRLRTGAAVLSEGLAARLFPDGDAMGKRVHPADGRPREDVHYYAVVGIAGTVKRERLDEEPAEILYLPMLGTTDRFVPSLHDAVFALRTTGEPLALVDAVRGAVWSVAPDVPLAEIRTMADVAATATARTRFTLLLLAVASATALFLGAVGIWGVVAYAVRRRSGEISVRMALGARQAEVVGMVVRQGARTLATGIVLGAAGALALSRSLQALLYEVAPGDPLILGTVAAGLASVGLFATWLPARRAGRIDPADALRRD